MNFDIKNLIKLLGVRATGSDYTLKEDTGMSSPDIYGDVTHTYTDVDTSSSGEDCIIQFVSNDDVYHIEGDLQVGDIICWFDEDYKFKNYLVLGNIITYLGDSYRIVKVLKNLGHYEVLASKL